MEKQDIFCCIFELEEWMKVNIPKLKDSIEKIDPSLINTYITVLFNFYDKAYEFSQYSQECPYMEHILDDYEEFIVAFSKLIKFYKCFGIEVPGQVDIYFYEWKSKRSDVEKLKHEIDLEMNENLQDIVNPEDF